MHPHPLPHWWISFGLGWLGVGLGAVRELGKPYDWLMQASAPSCHGHLAPGPVGGHWDWHTLFMRDSM